MTASTRTATTTAACLCASGINEIGAGQAKFYGICLPHRFLQKTTPSNPMRLPHFATLAVATAFTLACCSNTEEAKAPALPTETAPSPINVEVAPQPSPSPDAAAPVSGTAQLNPPHGEPGHRCEIPVGAPLDGSAPPPASSAPPITLNPPSPTPSSPTGVNSGKINPPHGEPGHDCAVPVGSPLP